MGAPGVLSNDFDPDINAEHKFAIVGVIPSTARRSRAAPLDIKADGSFDYTPLANFQGADTFTYTIADTASAPRTQPR